MLVDSHCHLNKLKGDLELMLEAAKEAGVSHMLCVSIDLETFPEVLAIAERYPNISASVGLHPSDSADSEPTVEDLVMLADHPKVVAIGETGLDYHYNDSGLDVMRERFRRHIRAAIKVNKPLIVHTRDAREDTIAILKEEKAEQAGGVMHCFTETWEMAQQAMALNFYISFSGIVTFKNASELASVAEKVPLSNMLIETDAPYLTPVPFRGKQNEPQYVRYVAEKIAELKGITYNEVIDETGRNFFDLFKVKS